MRKLYCDGGVISSNPSPIGGTWAWVLVGDDDCIIHRDGGFISVEEMGYDGVTNNQTELLAIVKGLTWLHDEIEPLMVCSDSAVSLGRVFKNFSMNNIPGWLERDLKEQRKRLVNFPKFSHLLLDGHPTVKQLNCGVGKSGHPTSRYNVLCDNMCNRIAAKYKVMA